MRAVRTAASRLPRSWKSVSRTTQRTTQFFRRTHVRTTLAQGGLFQVAQTLVDVRTRMVGPEAAVTEGEADDDGT